MNIVYIIDNKEISIKIDGNFAKGDNSCLLQQDVDLTSSTSWSSEGYTVESLLKKNEFQEVKKFVTQLIKTILSDEFNVDVNDFKLEKYHEFVNDSQHQFVVKKLQYGINTLLFPIEFKYIEDRISRILNIKVSSLAHHIDINEEPLKSYFQENGIKQPSIFNIRIVRPYCFNDNNPPHKDVWINRLKNAINLYMPVCGSTENSSLPLVPHSHSLLESEITRSVKGALVNKVKYNVPCAISINNQSIRLIRPYVKECDVLIFSPYLIHGGAYNFEKNLTRVSLEIRLWKAD